MISILSWNIMADCYNHSEKYTWYKNINWKHRKPLILEKIKSINSDIVCLQEVQKGHIVEEDFPNYNFIFQKKDYIIELLILIKKSFSLPEKIIHKNKYLILIWEEFSLTNVHLCTNRVKNFDKEREGCLASINKSISDKKNNIVIGDFNCTLDEIQKYNFNLKNVLKQSSVHGTFIGNKKNIDHIYVSEYIHVFETKILISNNTFLYPSDTFLYPCDDCPSDHLPIQLFFNYT